MGFIGLICTALPRLLQAVRHSSGDGSGGSGGSGARGGSGSVAAEAKALPRLRIAGQPPREGQRAAGAVVIAGL